eukprot:3634471-Prymnesium_polylepis.1
MRASRAGRLAEGQRCAIRVSATRLFFSQEESINSALRHSGEQPLRWSRGWLRVSLWMRGSAVRVHAGVSKSVWGKGARCGAVRCGAVRCG